MSMIELKLFTRSVEDTMGCELEEQHKKVRVTGDSGPNYSLVYYEGYQDAIESVRAIMLGIITEVMPCNKYGEGESKDD